MHRFTCHYVISGLGPLDPGGPWHFVQPCPMGVMPLWVDHGPLLLQIIESYSYAYLFELLMIKHSIYIMYSMISTVSVVNSAQLNSIYWYMAAVKLDWTNTENSVVKCPVRVSYKHSRGRHIVWQYSNFDLGHYVLAKTNAKVWKRVVYNGVCVKWTHFWWPCHVMWSVDIR